MSTISLVLISFIDDALVETPKRHARLKNLSFDRSTYFCSHFSVGTHTSVEKATKVSDQKALRSSVSIRKMYTLSKYTFLN